MHLPRMLSARGLGPKALRRVYYSYCRQPTGAASTQGCRAPNRRISRWCTAQWTTYSSLLLVGSFELMGISDEHDPGICMAEYTAVFRDKTSVFFFIFVGADYRRTVRAIPGRCAGKRDLEATVSSVDGAAFGGQLDYGGHYCGNTVTLIGRCWHHGAR